MAKPLTLVDRIERAIADVIETLDGASISSEIPRSALCVRTDAERIAASLTAASTAFVRALQRGR